MSREHNPFWKVLQAVSASFESRTTLICTLLEAETYKNIIRQFSISFTKEVKNILRITKKHKAVNNSN